METSTFRGPQLCALAGITYRQLDYWLRLGILPHPNPCPGSGSQRRFTVRHVQLAWLLGQLAIAGTTRTLPDVHALAHVESWTGLVLLTDRGVRHVADPLDLLDLLDAVTAVIVNLEACPLLDDARELVPL
jgi:hypothetical protein